MTQGVLKLIERALLTAFAQRPQRFGFAVGLGPDRRDWNDLLVQPRGAGPIDGKPPHQHHARLRTKPFNGRKARQSGLKALGEEARQ